jgi:hypothetical protein
VVSCDRTVDLSPSVGVSIDAFLVLRKRIRTGEKEDEEDEETDHVACALTHEE